MSLFMSSAEQCLNWQDKVGTDRFAIVELQDKVSELQDSASEDVPLSKEIP
jgi:hypothetical protein